MPQFYPHVKNSSLKATAETEKEHQKQIHQVPLISHLLNGTIFTLVSSVHQGINTKASIVLANLSSNKDIF